jgi:hypothetical protein
MERLTSADPFDPKPRTFEGTVYLDGFIRVSGTTRVESALRTKEAGQCPLVRADNGEHRYCDRIAPHILGHGLFLDDFMRFASMASSSHAASVVNSASRTSGEATTM